MTGPSIAAKSLTFRNALSDPTRLVGAVLDINLGLQHRYLGGLWLPIVALADVVGTQRIPRRS